VLVMHAPCGPREWTMRFTATSPSSSRVHIPVEQDHGTAKDRPGWLVEAGQRPEVGVPGLAVGGCVRRRTDTRQMNQRVVNTSSTAVSGLEARSEIAQRALSHRPAPVAGFALPRTTDCKRKNPLPPRPEHIRQNDSPPARERRQQTAGRLVVRWNQQAEQGRNFIGAPVVSTVRVGRWPGRSAKAVGALPRTYQSGDHKCLQHGVNEDGTRLGQARPSP